MGDAHNSEYIHDKDKRIQFISNFSGSAGTVLVTHKESYLWTDGRYHLAAEKELPDFWTLQKQGNTDVPTVLEVCKDIDGNIGVDPFLVPSSFVQESIEKFGKFSKASLTAVNGNLIDIVWGDDRPKMPSFPLLVLDVKYSGKSVEDKFKVIREKMKEKGAEMLLTTALDSIAWALNLRGSDIQCNPVFFSYLILTERKAVCFVEKSKVTQEVRKALPDVQFEAYDEFLEVLSEFVKGVEGKIWVDTSETSWGTSMLIEEERRIVDLNPIVHLKSVKNETEMEGFRNCHIRDGAAKTRYLRWLRETITPEYEEKLNEYDVAEKLLSFRAEADLFMGTSFTSISSSGANGAIIHYHPTKECSSTVAADEMYLIDSGGQYLDGTTDVTRTIHFGIPSDHERDSFTRVLKGVIQLSKLVFPEGTSGVLIDAFARQFLWQGGLDFQHGTGHGVGHFLNVHEGPHGITCSKRSVSTRMKFGLKAGMTVTNEPGYYEAGKFGIRIENLMIVKEVKTQHNFKDKQFLGFETVTMVPIDKELMNIEMLTSAERAWVNEYHQTVLEKLTPLLKDDEKDFAFLKDACSPI